MSNTDARKSRSLKRLVMPKPVKVRMTRHICGGEWLQASDGDKHAVAVMLVPIGEWALIKREAAMFRSMARELSAPYRGTVTKLSPKAEELVRRRHNKPELTDAPAKLKLQRRLKMDNDSNTTAAPARSGQATGYATAVDAAIAVVYSAHSFDADYVSASRALGEGVSASMILADEVIRLRAELGHIAAAKPSMWKDPAEFTPWAQNRARLAIESHNKPELSDATKGDAK